MTASTVTPGPAKVTDNRPVPRGVLPRGMQTWIMAGIAGGMVLIIVLAGRPAAPARPVAASAAAPVAPSAYHVREYQDRLRVLETRAAQQTPVGTPTPTSSPGTPPIVEPRLSRATEDPVVAERRRRNYDSLFASNVVLSRRRDSDRPDLGAVRLATAAAAAPMPARERPIAPTSIDDVADAVVRASARATTGEIMPNAAPAPSLPQQASRENALSRAMREESPGRQIEGSPINTGPVHRIPEGTVIDTVLTNRLDGASAGAVNCLVTNPVYSWKGDAVVVPAGARVLGDTKAVQAFGETRLAVSFHRLLMPDGRSYTLDQFPGSNQIGYAGLRDQVNQHYWSTFGAAAAVGLITGFAQFIATAGLATGTADRTVVIAGSAGDASAQASARVLDRLLNRLPTVTIREGHRVKVYLTRDLALPAYNAGF